MEDKETKIKVRTASDIDAELKELELKSKRLEVAAKEAELQDLQERLAERQLRRENIALNRITNGQTLRNDRRAQKQMETNCNHRKGGHDAEGIASGQGTDTDYAVIKHVFGWGDMWIRCMRCGKTWKPPIEDEFYFNDAGELVAKQDGKFDKEAFEQAKREYLEAVKFQTGNKPSGGIQFKFVSVDGRTNPEEYVRRKMLGVNLR